MKSSWVDEQKGLGNCGSSASSDTGACRTSHTCFGVSPHVYVQDPLRGGETQAEGKEQQKSRKQKQRSLPGGIWSSYASMPRVGLAMHHPRASAPPAISFATWYPCLLIPLMPLPGRHLGITSWVWVCLARARAASPEAGRRRPASPGHCSG